MRKCEFDANPDTVVDRLSGSKLPACNRIGTLTKLTTPTVSYNSVAYAQAVLVRSRHVNKERLRIAADDIASHKGTCDIDNLDKAQAVSASCWVSTLLTFLHFSLFATNAFPSLASDR
eukprot:gnl/MRDRNA2_/MRDRNA2_84412_c0_seq3.p1 gnl/MRDRNA2_/MRDRNA2_84412_c0~~gnl/MRDRNA2_/MRDRNA2_84412_c0_seq3.p1  ORF type:complete len:118 (+),score=2.67 gnl/MRDRNA2_/MRDRNA2_84412_c0_seq3:258-611(+)